MENNDYWIEENGYDDNGFQMGMVEEVHFGLPQPYPLNNYSMEGFFQSDKQQSVSIHRSAFTPYITLTHPNGAHENENSSKMGQNSLKRCFLLLRRMEEEERKLERHEMSSSKGAAPAVGHGDHQQLKEKSRRHMIAERNRREQFKHHFSQLYSLLPGNSKKDKHSILLNAAKYLRELKLRIAQLEEDNQTLQKSIHINSTTANIVDTIVYQSQEVTLEQSKHMLCQVKIRINVNIDPVDSCSTSMLIMELLERLRKGPLDIVSINSHIEGNGFQACIVIQTKDDGWDTSEWLQLGDEVRGSLLKTLAMRRRNVTKFTFIKCN